MLLCWTIAILEGWFDVRLWVNLIARPFGYDCCVLFASCLLHLTQEEEEEHIKRPKTLNNAADFSSIRKIEAQNEDCGLVGKKYQSCEHISTPEAFQK